MPSAFPRCNCGSEKSCLELSKGKTHQEGYDPNPQNHNPKKTNFFLPIKRTTPNKQNGKHNPSTPAHFAPHGWMRFSAEHRASNQNIHSTEFLPWGIWGWMMVVHIFLENKAGDFPKKETWDSSNSWECLIFSGKCRYNGITLFWAFSGKIHFLIQDFRLHIGYFPWFLGRVKVKLQPKSERKWLGNPKTLLRMWNKPGTLNNHL